MILLASYICHVIYEVIKLVIVVREERVYATSQKAADTITHRSKSGLVLPAQARAGPSASPYDPAHTEL